MLNLAAGAILAATFAGFRERGNGGRHSMNFCVGLVMPFDEHHDCTDQKKQKSESADQMGLGVGEFDADYKTFTSGCGSEFRK